ncbi:ras-related protein Rab-13-like isoform X1 [Porites lutea]|uniref:ras-related protein Rab-13-like isoform X1 n=1 Tax=Porites lutea TaxID=51062 RepID=UPI003CC5D4E3
MPPPDCTAKVVMIGDSGVGKSKILSSYNGERFNPTYMQTRERQIRTSRVQVGRRSVELQIWDTPGNPLCRTITAAYMRENVQGVIIVFDVTKDESYYNVQHWLKTVNQYVAGREHENCKFVFVGNKNDLAEKLGRKVLIESGEQLAKQHSGRYVDTSAKTKENIHKIFQTMAELILGENGEQVRNSVFLLFCYPFYG